MSLLPNPLIALFEPDIEVRAGTEHLAGAGEDHGADAVVAGEDGEDLLELEHHGGCEGVVVAGAVEGDGDDGCGGMAGVWVVREADLDVRDGGIGAGRWGWERWHVSGGGGCGGG